MWLQLSLETEQQKPPQAVWRGGYSPPAEMLPLTPEAVTPPQDCTDAQVQAHRAQGLRESCVSAVAANKYLTKGSQGREGLFWLPVWGCGHHSRDTMATGACSGCPHCIHGQEAERIVCWCPTHFRLCILSGTPAHRTVVLVFRVGFPPLLTHQNSLSQTSSVHDDYRESLLFWTHWAFHMRSRCTLGAFTQNHSSLLALNTKYWHWLYKKRKINRNAWF